MVLFYEELLCEYLCVFQGDVIFTFYASLSIGESLLGRPTLKSLF